MAPFFSNITATGVRLVNGPTAHEGRVELYDQTRGAWGSVDNDYWTMTDAQVLCRQLGMGPALSISFDSRYGGPSVAIQYAGFKCNGSESQLANGCPSAWPPCCW